MANVLVVDDEDFRDSLKRYLEVEAGWTVYTASNAEEAIKIVSEHRDTLDAIVLDRNMPDRSGHLAYTGDDVVEWLFDQDLLARLCLIMLTGFADVGIAKMALSMGGWHFLEKPVPPREILRMLAPGIAHKQSHRLRRLILSSPSIQSVVDRIQLIVQETLAPDHFNVYLLADDISRDLTQGVKVDPNRRYVDHVRNQKSYLYAGSLSEAQNWGAVDRNTSTLMAVRIEAYENAEGVGVMAMESQQEGAFDPRWHDVLSYLADLVGMALTLDRSIEQRRQAEEASLRLLNKELKHRLATSIGTMFQHLESLEADLKTIGFGGDRMLAKAGTVKRHLDSLVHVMRELGEVASSTHLRKEAVDPTEIARRVLIEKLQDTEITHAVDERSPGVRIQADREHLTYCLECIIQNAVEAVQERGARVYPSDAEFNELLHRADDIDITIVTGIADEPSMAEIRVKDDGIGFDQEIADRLFNPLFTTKLSHSADRQVGDRGIGLYSVKRLITAMGGTVKAGRGEGRGSEFVIRLRLAEPVSEGGDGRRGS